MSRQQAKTSYSRQQGRKPHTDRNRAYIEGNTVRKLDAVPNRYPDAHEERERKEKERRANRAAKHNRQRAMQMGPGYVLFLTAAVCVTLGICLIYVQLQSDINGRMKHIASLESEMLDLKTGNEATLRRIETSVNLEEIRSKALNEMGMVYPTKDQIIYYDVDLNDYMNQYQDIPEK